MMVALRADNAYPIVFAVQRDEGVPPTRIETGLTAMWYRNELIIPIDVDAVDDVLRIVAETVRWEAATPEGDAV